MLHLIIAFVLSPFHHSAKAVAQVQPCVWPNVCRSETVETVAQVQTCVWPHICKSTSETDGPVHTCDFPNKCG